MDNASQENPHTEQKHTDVPQIVVEDTESGVAFTVTDDASCSSTVGMGQTPLTASGTTEGRVLLEEYDNISLDDHKEGEECAVSQLQDTNQSDEMCQRDVNSVSTSVNSAEDSVSAFAGEQQADPEEGLRSSCGGGEEGSDTRETDGDAEDDPEDDPKGDPEDDPDMLVSRCFSTERTECYVVADDAANISVSDTNTVVTETVTKEMVDGYEGTSVVLCVEECVNTERVEEKVVVVPPPPQVVVVPPPSPPPPPQEEAVVSSPPEDGVDVPLSPGDEVDLLPPHRDEVDVLPFPEDEVIVLPNSGDEVEEKMEDGGEVEEAMEVEVIPLSSADEEEMMIDDLSVITTDPADDNAASIPPVLSSSSHMDMYQELATIDEVTSIEESQGRPLIEEREEVEEAEEPDPDYDFDEVDSLAPPCRGEERLCVVPEEPPPDYDDDASSTDGETDVGGRKISKDDLDLISRESDITVLESTYFGPHLPPPPPPPPVSLTSSSEAEKSAPEEEEEEEEAPVLPSIAAPKQDISPSKFIRSSVSFRRKNKSHKGQRPFSFGDAQYAQSALDKLRRLGSLSKDHGSKGEKNKDKAEKESREDEQLVDCTEIKMEQVEPAAGDQLIQRCVIIQRDEKGYGLTVSGDNPVFVRSVKENGAAARAGVQEADRIIKVNGTLVTKSNHIRVVNLIKSGSYVALTLLGRPPGHHQHPLEPPPQPQYTPPAPTTPSTPTSRISGPHAVDADKDQELRSQKVATIRMMYEQVADEFEKLKSDIQRSGNETLQTKMDQKSQLLHRLEEQLFTLTGIPTESGMRSPLGLPPFPGQKRGSGELLEQIEGENDEGLPPPHPQSSWGGSKHRRGESMPDTLYDTVTNSNQVQRSKSDSRHRAASQEESPSNEDSVEGADKNRTDVHQRRRRTLIKTSSLPSSVYETPGEEAAEGHSPSPPNQVKEAWSPISEGVAEMNAALAAPLPVEDREQPAPPMEEPAPPTPVQESKFRSSLRMAVNLKRRSGGEESRLQAVSPHQVDVICMDDDEFSTLPAVAANSPPTSSSSSTTTSSTSTLTVVAPHQVDVISMDDEEFSTDDEHSDFLEPILQHHRSPSGVYQFKLEEHGPFSELSALRHRPAHTAVFLHYLISNSDPAPLLFYLVTDGYSQGNMKEMRKWAYEIHSTFLLDRSPLRVSVDDAVIRAIDQILMVKHDKEDAMKTIFHPARHTAQKEISELLQDFRNKRALGLGSLYGDHELQDENMDRQSELRIVEKYLWPHFERLHREGDEVGGTDRQRALASALATYMRQVGMTSTKTRYELLERSPSFLNKDKKMFKFKSKAKGSNVASNGHNFCASHYLTVTNCNQCQGLIWGIGYQGYQCLNCDFNAHKACMEKVQEMCSGSRKKKDKRASFMFDKIITRKPSSNSPAAIKEAQLIQNLKDEPPSTPSTSPLQRSSTDVEDDEAVREAQQRMQEDNASSSGGSSITFGRAISMPSVRESSAVAHRSSTFYMQAPKPSQFDSDLDVIRTNNRVGRMVERYSDMSKSIDEAPVSTPPRCRSPETTDIDDPKMASNPLGRSESLNKKRESRKNVRRTRSDIQMDEHTLKALNQSGSSSNSSLSNNLDSPCSSHEVLNDINNTGYHKASHTSQDYDSDLEMDSELPSLDTVIPKEVLKKLKPKEKKRQEVINELFHTERNHVRNFKLMKVIFKNPMDYQPWISEEFVRLLLPNLEDMIQVHGSLSTAFREKRKEETVVKDVADMLLNRFDGEPGQKFRQACAEFCGNQSHALEVLRVKQKKDQKLALFLQEAASNPLCRRLALKDFIPTAMQRLTKYPLLIDNLLKYTPSNADEYTKLKRALQCSKEILAYVNSYVQDCENKQKLHDLQKRLDRRPLENSTHPAVQEYKNLNLNHHRMIYDGLLTWRIRNKQIEVHVVLLEDVLVLLQKVDDRLVLRCQSTTVTPGREDTKFTHSPIIRLTNLLTRNVATDKRAFFLVSTSEMGPQIYELIAYTADARKKWFKYITDATESYKNKEGIRNRRAGQVAAPEAALSGSSLEESSSSDKISESKEESKEETELNENLGSYSKASGGSVDSLEALGKVEVMQIDQAALIQPTEVVVSDAVFVEAANSTTLTPLESLQQKEEAIRSAMDEKRRLVADMLHIPVDEYDNIAEMACEVDGEKDSRELLLASISHADRLTSLINTSLTSVSPQVTPQVEEPLRIVEEGDVVEPPPTSQADEAPKMNDVMITLSAQQLLQISTRLNEQLIQLLSLVTAQDSAKQKSEVEEERPSEQTEEGSLVSRPVSLVSMESAEEVVCVQPPLVSEESVLGTTPISVVASQQEVDVEFERLHILDEEDEEEEEQEEEEQDSPPPPSPPPPTAPQQCSDQSVSSCSSSEERQSSSADEEFADATSDSQNNNIVA